MKHTFVTAPPLTLRGRYFTHYRRDIPRKSGAL